MDDTSREARVDPCDSMLCSASSQRYDSRNVHSVNSVTQTREILYEAVSNLHICLSLARSLAISQLTVYLSADCLCHSPSVARAFSLNLNLSGVMRRSIVPLQPANRTKGYMPVGPKSAFSLFSRLATNPRVPLTRPFS